MGVRDRVAWGSPARQRELRAQGRATMQRLLDAGTQVFTERGFPAARVDDIVRAARTSHGTFYLYFTNKEDLLATLASRCADEVAGLADRIGPIDGGPEGYQALRTFIADFVGVYRRHGAVIRAWMEGQVPDRKINREGIAAFTAIGTRLGERLHTAGTVQHERAAVGALMALLERVSYVVSSRDLPLEGDASLDTLARLVHRGFFGAPAPA
ncbi:MAG: TetR/AcrR family transcriptional regulator [Acidimicrobiia bacterium]